MVRVEDDYRHRTAEGCIWALAREVQRLNEALTYFPFIRSGSWDDDLR